MPLTTTQRAVMTAHARDCLHSIEGCPHASSEDLGRARDLLNHVSTHHDPEHALEELQRLETETWEGNPPHRRTP